MERLFDQLHSALMGQGLSEGQARAWMREPHPALSGMVPWKLCALGQQERLLELIREGASV